MYFRSSSSFICGGNHSRHALSMSSDFVAALDRLLRHRRAVPRGQRIDSHRGGHAMPIERLEQTEDADAIAIGARV